MFESIQKFARVEFISDDESQGSEYDDDDEIEGKILNWEPEYLPLL